MGRVNWSLKQRVPVAPQNGDLSPQKEKQQKNNSSGRNQRWIQDFWKWGMLPTNDVELFQENVYQSEQIANLRTPPYIRHWNKLLLIALVIMFMSHIRFQFILLNYSIIGTTQD